MAEKKEVIGRLQLIAASLIWGTSFMFVKTAQEEFQPFVLMALRLSIAAAVLGIVFIKKLKGLNRQYIWRGAILGFCLAGGMGLQAMGLNYMSPGTNAFLTASYCLFLPFFAWALTRKRPDIWKFCGSIICLAGIGLVSLENDLSIGEGSLITVSSGLMYAGQMACASVFVKGRDPMLLSIVQFFCCDFRLDNIRVYGGNNTRRGNRYLAAGIIPCSNMHGRRVYTAVLRTARGGSFGDRDNSDIRGGICCSIFRVVLRRGSFIPEHSGVYGDICGVVDFRNEIEFFEKEGENKGRQLRRGILYSSEIAL